MVTQVRRAVRSEGLVWEETGGGLRHTQVISAEVCKLYERIKSKCWKLKTQKQKCLQRAQTEIQRKREKKKKKE